MESKSPLPSLPVALVVDYDADARQLYAQCLRLAGFEVEEAGEGRAALAKALASHHDVIVTETRLPGIDGYELCEILRRDPATRAVPIVVVTGEACPVDFERARRAAASTVLVKPCLPEALLAAIRRAMEAANPNPPTAAVGDAVGPPGGEHGRPLSKIRTHQRGETVAPPSIPPALICPVCDQPLVYDRSYVGGVSARHPEQWDLFECRAGCGAFHYRQRTRRLRRL